MLFQLSEILLLARIDIVYKNKDVARGNLEDIAVFRLF